MNDPVLVILCAGKSSRFGRPKQIEPIGPKGEYFLDYSIQYGIEVGFKKIIIVGRRGVLVKIRQHLKCYLSLCQIVLVTQKNEFAGTAYAVLDAHESACILFNGANDVFMLNGDDYYARQTILKGFEMKYLPKSYLGGIVAYEVQNCLPPTGMVNRGKIKTNKQNHLIAITESSYQLLNGSIFNKEHERVQATDLVSMNAIFLKAEFLSKYLREFLILEIGNNSKEKGIIDAIEWSLKINSLGYFNVSVVSSHWTGLTHPFDLELVKSYLFDK